MTINELFEKWLSDSNKRDLCIYGEISGGPGFYGFGRCTHLNHTDVRYGCSFCPSNCPDYREESKSVLFQRFYRNYQNQCNYYNEEYGIDKMDPLYEERK